MYSTISSSSSNLPIELVPSSMVELHRNRILTDQLPHHEVNTRYLRIIEYSTRKCAPQLPSTPIRSHQIIRLPSYSIIQRSNSDVIPVAYQIRLWLIDIRYHNQRISCFHEPRDFLFSSLTHHAPSDHRIYLFVSPGLYFQGILATAFQYNIGLSHSQVTVDK